jgi:hypothetical protein
MPSLEAGRHSGSSSEDPRSIALACSAALPRLAFLPGRCQATLRCRLTKLKRGRLRRHGSVDRDAELAQLPLDVDDPVA